MGEGDGDLKPCLRFADSHLVSFIPQQAKTLTFSPSEFIMTEDKAWFCIRMASLPKRVTALTVPTTSDRLAKFKAMLAPSTGVPAR